MRDGAQGQHHFDGQQLVQRLREWAHEAGLSQIGVAAVDLSAAESGLVAWLQAGFHGTMGYMARHGLERARPAELVPGTVSVITARLDYLPRDTPDDWVGREQQRLQDPTQAVVSVYARGRDYHKVLRSRLQKLADRLAGEIGAFGHRVFTDSAPVLEVELAARSGIGWRGKHTLALDREGGSMFFLGEIYVDLALPPSEPVSAHCGQCTACLAACPTGAIVAPYRLDARRCISYLTIEHKGPIDPELRPLVGNRIYGCDDCQLACPWNKYARVSTLTDFDARSPLRTPTLLELWAWSEADFLRHTEGSAMRRIGWQRWRRNLAVAMGNAVGNARANDPGPASRQVASEALCAALLQARSGADDLVGEHIDWALAQSVQGAAQGAATPRSTPSASGSPAMPSKVETVIKPATKAP